MKRTIPKSRNAARLAVLCGCLAGFLAAAQAQEITGTNQIAFSDFDTAIPGWSYGYFYPGGSPGTWVDNRIYLDPAIDPTNGPTTFQYTFDNSGYESLVSADPGYGYGTGFGMPLNWDFDYTKFTSLNLEDYILSWDARVEGLSNGQATASCAMEFRLGPDGARVLQKALNYNPGSNWTHFVFTLDQGSYGDGTSYTSFTNGVAAGISAIAFNQNQHMPHDRFGFDADNVIYLDNLKLEVISYAGPPPPPPPKQGVPIFDFNFDDKPLDSSWTAFPGGTGWSGNANKASYWVVYPAVGAGMGGSQAYIMAMDNTTIATDPPGIPSYAGGQTGGGGPVNYAPITSPELKDYRLSLDARVEGLAEGQETAPVTAQIHFRAPDDTLQPPDGDTDNDVIIVVNVEIQGIGTNWQTFTPLLKDGTAQSGSVANFKSHFDKINSMDFQFQILNSANTTLWGADADNQIVIDNFKLERLFTATPPLSVQTLGNDVVVSWAAPDTGSVKLLWGNSVTAITNEVAGAASPYTNAVSAAPKYFRTLWVPPTIP